MDSASHPNPGSYCDRCYGLMSTEDALRALTSAIGYQHYIGAEAKASAAKGCPLCQQLLMKWPANMSNDTDRLVCWAHCGGKKCQTDPYNSMNQVKVSYPYIFDGLICFRVGGGEHSHQRWLKTFTLFASPDDNAASVLPRRPAITDVGGDSAILSARQLFESCRDNHQLCPGRTTPLLPTRVIDVGTDGENGKVKLYIASPAELGDYAALSYCWGGPQPVLLTTKNSSQMLEDIPYDSLPETIKDAIIVTRGLELRFLWIDALCIIQEGDETDKIREIGCMGQLYKNATVTIFAASAKSVSEGFLHSRFKPASFSLPITCPDGSQGTAQLMLGDTHSSMYPLNTRGWTLQETLLSSRKLVYGEKEQIWDCATEQKRELPSSFYDPEWSFQQLPQEIFVPGGLISAASQQEIWGSVLYEFTGRCLSFPEDRYAAVTGVISELETAFQDDCSFGLWRGNFMRQLAWARTGTTREEADGLLCGAPAWSWASRQFQISFLSFEPDDANCWELRDNSVVLNRKLIKGHDISVIHRAGCTKYLDWASPIGPFYDTFLLEHEGKDVFYLLLGQFRNETVCESTMVLVSTEHEGEFRRLGLVYNGSGTNWFDHLENQEVILI